jgi:hypothetical protein
MRQRRRRKRRRRTKTRTEDNDPDEELKQLDQWNEAYQFLADMGQ